MKEVKGIKSLTRPIEIDDISSETTVYMRYNIREEVEIDPVFKTENIVFVYDETQYTIAEWYRLCINEANAKIKNLENVVKGLADELEISIEL